MATMATMATTAHHGHVHRTAAGALSRPVLHAALLQQLPPASGRGTEELTGLGKVHVGWLNSDQLVMVNDVNYSWN